MKRLLLGITTLVCLLGGCSSSKGAAPSTGSTSTGSVATAGSHSAVTSAASVPALQKIYLSQIRKWLPDGGDRNLLAIAHAVCTAFDDGATWIQEVKAFLDQGVTATKSGGAIATIVTTTCPEHENLLPAS